MSGPDNYNHNKLTKVITSHNINSAEWVNVIEHNYVSPQKNWMQKLTGNCSPSCEIRAIRITKRAVVTFFFASSRNPYNIQAKDTNLPKGWHVSTQTWNKIRTDVMSNPEYSPDLVYLSGAGGSATMMKYDGKWWFVFGTPNVNNKGKPEAEHERLLVLHNVLLPTWDQSYVEKHVNDLEDAFVRYVNGEQKDQV
jgi:hypothetical protein